MTKKWSLDVSMSLHQSSQADREIQVEHSSRLNGSLSSLKQTNNQSKFSTHCTEVHFASFLSGEFTTMAVINPSEKKLAKRTSVHCTSYSDHAHCSQPMGENGVTKGNSRVGGVFSFRFPNKIVHAQ